MAEEKAKLTQEQKDANKARYKARLANIAIIKAMADKDPKTQEALKAVLPSAYNIRPGREGGSKVVALFDKFANFVKDKKQVSEDEIFKTFKIGRKDCAQLIKLHLKKAVAENRIWVAFDSKSGIYSCVATGKATPANWTGYVPAEGIKQVAPALK